MRAIAKLCVALAAAAPLLARAHGGVEHTVAPGWQGDAWVIALLLASTLGYAGGMWRLHGAQRTRVLGGARIAAFVAGSALLVVALLSPLDGYADHYFSAHMGQHLLLMLAAPPLLVVSQPVIAWLWCLPPGMRGEVTRWWAGGQSRTRATIAWLLHPLAVWSYASAALWFWHLPRPYAWALANEGIHTLEHATFFLSSLAFWYLLLAPRARSGLSRGAAIVYGVGFGMQNGFLGAILTFSTHPLYAAHSMGPGPFGLTALEDQQLAGLLMWVPASILHIGLLAILAHGWLRDEARRSDARSA